MGCPREQFSWLESAMKLPLLAEFLRSTLLDNAWRSSVVTILPRSRLGGHAEQPPCSIYPDDILSSLARAAGGERFRPPHSLPTMTSQYSNTGRHTNDVLNLHGGEIFSKYTIYFIYVGRMLFTIIHWITILPSSADIGPRLFYVW